VGIHLPDAHRHRVDAALQLGLEFLDFGLLFSEGRGPRGDPTRGRFALTDLESEAESGRQNGDQHGGKGRHGEGMSQVEMLGTTFTAREEDDVHRASSRPWGQFGSLRPCSL
jgi:hypothetical protein